MLTRLISKVVGPKVFLGVGITALVAITTLSYLLMNAWETVGTAEAESLELSQTVKEQSVELSHIRVQNQRRETAVANAIDARDKAQAQSRESTQQLKKALTDDECAQTPHPDAVFDSLRVGASGSNQD